MRRPKLIAVTAIFVFFVAAVISSGFWLPMVGLLYMTDNAPSSGADYIVVLMGEPYYRASVAAELHQRGVADKVLMANNKQGILTREGFRTKDVDIASTVMQRNGVPASSIEIVQDSEVTSTAEEAQAILDYLQQQDKPNQTLVLVTTWWHTARAEWIFQRFNNAGHQIFCAGQKSERDNPHTWWKKEGSFTGIYMETIKWVYYRMNY